MSYTPGASGGVVADPASPHDVDAGAASVGISEKFSRGDHRHHVATGSPVALTPGASSAPGSSTNLAAADHVHALPAFGSSAGTFAEGSDSRITSAVQPARQIIAGTGLLGGGSFAADRTLSVSFGTSSTTVTVGNDSRLADDRVASGLRTASGIVAVSAATAPAASSVLTASSGTAASWQPLPVGVVPSRQIIAGTGLAGGGDLTADRTLSLVFGTTASSAARGDDPRLSDSRSPTGAAGGGLSGSYPNPSVLYGTSSASAAVGNDPRLSDARTPLMHNSSHERLGSDEMDVTGLAGVLFEPQQSALIQPVIAATNMVGTAETVVAPLKVTIPANRMTLGHSVMWTLVLSQTAWNTTTPTVTFRIRYGTLGTTADALVATMIFGAGTTATTNQFLYIYHSVRGPLAAGCAAMSNALCMKGAANGIGGGLGVVTPTTTTMATFTATPAVQTYWTVTAAMGNATLAYAVQNSAVELVEW